MKTILLAGGGSGGHVTPLLAVADELKKTSKNYKVIYVGEKGGKFEHLVKSCESIDKVTSVRAGKFRRYHGESFISQALDIKTWLLNIRDFFYTLVGLLQGLLLVFRTKPDIVFIKGGFVGAPIGLACALLRRPYITHDSDTTAGLANKLISRWAVIHAVGMPTKFYSYPEKSMVYTGIPVGKEYRLVTKEKKKEYRKKLGIKEESRVICLTGGSLGAVKLNEICAPLLEKLLKEDKDLVVIHQSGKYNGQLYQNLTSEERKRLVLESYMPDLHLYTGASDVTITRAGATAIACLAIQKIPLIVIPNPFLTGGHQIKNAEHLSHSRSAVVLDENALVKNNKQLADALSELLNNKTKREEISQNLGLLAQPDASKEISKIISSYAEKKVAS